MHPWFGGNQSPQHNTAQVRKKRPPRQEKSGSLGLGIPVSQEDNRHSQESVLGVGASGLAQTVVKQLSKELAAVAFLPMGSSDLGITQGLSALLSMK